MHLKQARPAVLPAAALAAAGVTIWLDVLGGSDVGRDDLCPAVLTIILSVSATVQVLMGHYYRRITRDRQQAHDDVGVLAEGVAAYMRQDGSTVAAPDRKGS